MIKKDSFAFKKEMAQGVKWLGLSQMLGYVLQFIVWVILARLLPPENFGALSVSMAFSNFAIMFNELGMGTALIQKTALEYRHKVTTFWTCIAIGAIFLIFALSTSSLIASFFKNPAIEVLITIFALKLLIDSFGTLQESLLKRELSFKSLMIIENISSLIFGSVAITMVYKGFGISSMAWGYLAKSVLKVILLWISCDFRPSLEFDKESFRELFDYGKNIMGFKIISYISGNIDILLIGKFLGAASLGYYTLALNLVNFPRQKLSSIVSQVAFPALSKIQDHLDEVRNAYTKIIRYATVVNFPLLVGLMFTAPYFVSAVYSDKWIGMVVPLQILCVYGIGYSITTFVGIIFNSTGHPEYSFRFSLITLAGVVAAVLAGLPYGLEGIAVSLSVYSIIVNILGNVIVGRLIKMPFLCYVNEMKLAVTGTLFMAAGLFALTKFKDSSLLIADIWFLSLMIMCGTAIYVTALFFANRDTFIEMKSIVKNMFGRSREYEKCRI